MTALNEGGAIVRGGIRMFAPEDAINVVESLRRRGTRVLGLDAFLITAVSTQPVLENSVEYTIGESDSWTKAKLFLSEMMQSGLVFEIVADDHEDVQ